MSQSKTVVGFVQGISKASRMDPANQMTTAQSSFEVLKSPLWSNFS